MTGSTTARHAESRGILRRRFRRAGRDGGGSHAARGPRVFRRQRTVAGRGLSSIVFCGDRLTDTRKDLLLHVLNPVKACECIGAHQQGPSGRDRRHERQQNRQHASSGASPERTQLSLSYGGGLIKVDTAFPAVSHRLLPSMGRALCRRGAYSRGSQGACQRRGRMRDVWAKPQN